ncbi:MAG TPA: glycosyltransferase family 87 protein, partial [Roseiflexaceae bacterium]|nr:glycosyltransferase family 87 protein [Roseiflexaceae bacterium]
MTINLIALALAIGWLFLIGLTLTPEVDDFKQFRRGAIDLLQAGDPYATRADPAAESQRQPGTVDESGERGFKYPPVFAYLFQPFGLLEHRTGQLLWFGINILMLGALIALCIRMSSSAVAQRYWGVVVLGTVLAPPTRLSLQLGQVSILMALLLVGCGLLARRRPAIAGLLLTLASIIKLYPALLGVYFLLRGPRRVAWWSLAWVIALVAVFLPVYGVQHYRTFAEVVILSSNHPYTAEFNLSLVAYWDRIFRPSPYAVPLLNAPLIARALTILSSLLVLGICLVARRRSDDDESYLLEYSLWLCAMLILSPINGSYNLLLLLLPLLVIMGRLERAPDRRARNWLIVGTALACFPPAWSDGIPAV